eukprot:gene1003-biopygen6055
MKRHLCQGLGCRSGRLRAEWSRYGTGTNWDGRYRKKTGRPQRHAGGKTGGGAGDRPDARAAPGKNWRHARKNCDTSGLASGPSQFCPGSVTVDEHSARPAARRPEHRRAPRRRDLDPELVPPGAERGVAGAQSVSMGEAEQRRRLRVLDGPPPRARRRGRRDGAGAVHLPSVVEEEERALGAEPAAVQRADEAAVGDEGRVLVARPRPPARGGGPLPAPAEGVPRRARRVPVVPQRALVERGGALQPADSARKPNGDKQECQAKRLSRKSESQRQKSKLGEPPDPLFSARLHVYCSKGEPPDPLFSARLHAPRNVVNGASASGGKAGGKDGAGGKVRRNNGAGGKDGAGGTVWRHQWRWRHKGRAYEN